MKTIYIHTIDDKPAAFDGEQLCFLGGYSTWGEPCYSLRELRQQQQASIRYRRQIGAQDELDDKYGYVRLRAS